MGRKRITPQTAAHLLQYIVTQYISLHGRQNKLLMLA